MANNPKSTKNDKREAARLEAQRLRETAARREKRNRLILIGAVVALVGLIAIAGVMIAQSAGRTLLSDFEGTKPAGSDLNGGIPVGAEGAGSENEGAVTVDVYLDFMCPYCGQFEQVNGADLETMVNDGTATIVYHPLANLDGLSQGTQFSTRAANAFATVANDAPEHALAFTQAMFANQPAENTPGLSDEEIASIAVEAGVPQEVADTFTDATFFEWVDVATQQSKRDGVSGTPTVMINGDDWDGNWSVAGELAAAVEDAA